VRYLGSSSPGGGVAIRFGILGAEKIFGIGLGGDIIWETGCVVALLGTLESCVFVRKDNDF
jgi:hypothetical protein